MKHRSETYHFDSILACPWCGAKHNAATVGSMVDATKPTKGDVGICSNCAGIYEITGKWGKVQKTDIETLKIRLSKEEFDLFEQMLSLVTMRISLRKTFN